MSEPCGCEGRLSEPCRLKDFKFEKGEAHGKSLELAGDGFDSGFEVLAIGDLRHIGQAELPVRFTDRAAQGGRCDSTSFLVLNLARDTGTIRATNALDVLVAALR